MNVMALSPGVWLAIGLGAALGAWSRLALSVWLNDLHHSVPLGTLLANLIGGFAIGLAMGWFERQPELDPVWRLVLTTGFLGALTTFSTFSLEAVNLLVRGQLVWAIAHSALHLVGSIGAVFLGLRLASA